MLHVHVYAYNFYQMKSDIGNKCTFINVYLTYNSISAQHLAIPKSFVFLTTKPGFVPVTDGGGGVFTGIYDIRNITKNLL